MCQIGNLVQECNDEQWLTIPYLPNYQASCWGRIRNAKTGRIKSQDKSWNGYYRIQVWTGPYKERQNKKYRIHRLVACTWLFDDGKEMDVNHKDLNRGNNTAYNLEYLTHQENCAYEPAQ